MYINKQCFSAKKPVPGSWESFAFMWVWIIKEQYKLYLIAIYNYFTILAKGFPLINGKMFQYKTWFTAFLVLNAMKMKIKSRFQARRCWKQAHFNTSHQNRIIQELLCKTLAGYYSYIAVHIIHKRTELNKRIKSPNFLLNIKIWSLAFK